MSEPQQKSLPLPDPSQTSDLMNRLQAFLPQLQAANQDLGSAPRVDIDLQSENDEDDDSSSDDSDSDENLVERNGASTNSSLKETEPSIQIQFAMGDLEENPIMELLADGSDKDSKSSDEDSSLVEVEVSPAVAKERVVTKLLSESSQTLQQPAKTGTKPLITELE